MYTQTMQMSTVQSTQTTTPVVQKPVYAMGVDTIRIHIHGAHFIRPFVSGPTGLWQGKNLQNGIQITFHSSHGASGKTWAAADLPKLHAVVRQVARESAQYVCGGTYDLMMRSILGGSITVLDLTMDLNGRMDEIDIVAPRASFPGARSVPFVTAEGHVAENRYWGMRSYTTNTGKTVPATARELKLYDKTRQMREVKNVDIEHDIARLEMTLNRGDTVGRHMGVTTMGEFLRIGAREFRLRIASCFSELLIAVRGAGVNPLTARQRKEILARGGIMARKLQRFERKNANQKTVRNVEKTKTEPIRICLSTNDGYTQKPENAKILRGACRGEPGTHETTHIDDANRCNDCIRNTNLHNGGGGKPMTSAERAEIEEILDLLRGGIVEVWDLPEVA